MKLLLNFNDWLAENAVQQRPTKKIPELNINRQFSKDPFTGDKYETELFAMFRRLKPRIEALPVKPNLDEWFEMMQNSDNQFYAMVQADELGQPDVRELWRDLTGRRASKMAKYGLAESKLDSEWSVLTLTEEHAKRHRIVELFEKFGDAFADLESKTIFINGRIFEEQGYGEDHVLAVEAHEIAHLKLGHTADRTERAEREADWFGIRLLESQNFNEAARLLEERYVKAYNEPSSTLPNTDNLQAALENYVQ